MDKEILHQVVLETEKELFGRVKASRPQWTMWLNQSSFLKSNTLLKLVEVRKHSEWKELELLRREIEVPFGVTEASKVHEMIVEIRQLVEKWDGIWYLGKSDSTTVGSIGLIILNTQIGKVGRLLDVDIAPQFQGRGYGNMLLAAIIQIAATKDVLGLCLKVDDDRWAKDWYVRQGFIKVGHCGP